MVVADLRAACSGEDAMLNRRSDADYVIIEGLLPDQGHLRRREVWGGQEVLPELEQSSAFIAAMQKAPRQSLASSSGMLDGWFQQDWRN